MSNNTDPTDLPNCDFSRSEMISNALGASRIVSIEPNLFSMYTVDSSHDPLPSEMIMAAFQRMIGEVAEADLLTEEDELT